jgi:hypothetical protein
MPNRKVWKQAQSVGHANTRLIFITADLVKTLLPDSEAKTIIGGKWELAEGANHKNCLVLVLRKFTAWPPVEDGGKGVPIE